MRHKYDTAHSLAQIVIRIISRGERATQNHSSGCISYIPCASETAGRQKTHLEHKTRRRRQRIVPYPNLDIFQKTPNTTDNTIDDNMGVVEGRCVASRFFVPN